MKNTIKSLLVISLVLAASSAFAGVISPGTTYSIGSTQPTVFKTSPKVTIVTDLTAGTSATAWVGNSLHLSGLNKAKGLMYGTSSDDPGTYSKNLSGTSALPTAITALSAMTQEQ